jgi:AraC-like DNA-binding protein
LLENLTADLSVDKLAEKVAMSPRNFTRVFTRETGASRRATSRKPAWPPRGSVWSRLTRRWIVSPSKRDLAAALTCDDCLKNSLTSLQVNIVNDFTAAKWRKVILFCHLRHNLSVLL